VPSRDFPCAASVLAGAVLDGPATELREAARTRVSVHFETGDPRQPVLTVCTPDAVRLPDAVVTMTLPPSEVCAGDGRLQAAAATWRVARWWRPPAPRGLPVPPRSGRPVPDLPEGALPPGRLPAPTYDGLVPADLLGAGAGLTPAGDDILAGALVTAHATGDPRLDAWTRAIRAALATRTTTAVSRGMLHQALRGYATPQLAACLDPVCRGLDPAAAVADLLAVGHSSGAALWFGVVHTLETRSMRSAA
jgi:hypothetical protein